MRDGIGIFVGIRKKSNEVWIAIKDSIVTARSVRRIPIEKRWSEDCLTWVTRVPWNRYNCDGCLWGST